MALVNIYKIVVKTFYPICQATAEILKKLSNVPARVRSRHRNRFPINHLCIF